MAIYVYIYYMYIRVCFKIGGPNPKSLMVLMKRRHVPLVVLDDPFCALDKEVAVQAIPTEVEKDGWSDFPGI